MTNKKAVAAARTFLKDHKIKKVSFMSIKQILMKQGYNVIEYSSIYNDGDVSEIITALKLDEYIKSSKGFTYADSSHRLVFLNEDLSEGEKMLVLLHEEGHISCEHFNEYPVIGRDVIQEYEANEFVHYILTPSIKQRLNLLWDKHRVVCITTVIMIFLILLSAIVIPIIIQENSYYNNYYVNETGSKYHTADCLYVKDKTSIHRLTKEEFESGLYTPCDKCIN